MYHNKETYDRFEPLFRKHKYIFNIQTLNSTLCRVLVHVCTLCSLKSTRVEALLEKNADLWKIILSREVE